MINGVTILARVSWWSKEYYIEICEPFTAKIDGARIMYGVPCKFVFDNPANGKELPLFKTCVDKIREYFKKNCKIAAI